MSAVDPKLIKRVKADKTRRRASSVPYRDSTRIAFVVHSFNRVSNIDPLLAGLRCLGNHELIVCEDGSLDGSHEKWMSHLGRPNDFLIHSNDLHEIRILDRAIRFARAEVICLVQDDDLIPREISWLNAALKHFNNYPKLAIIGGFMGFRSFHPHPKKAKPLWGPAPFQFVHHVNIGPYFIRKQHYEALGGWDYSFSRVGEPGICFDNELCLRAWINGYQVGYSFVPFKGPPGHYSLNGGTVLFSGTVRRRNQLRNQEKIFAMYAKHTKRIDRLVKEANAAQGSSWHQNRARPATKLRAEM
jgi:glycosyltransferase involved in cell wall biosynthesis